MIKNSSKFHETPLELLPLHKNPKYLQGCCVLINEEWKRSDTARLHSLQSSCDTLPTSLILVSKENLIGHCKLTKIPSIMNACFIESVVIRKDVRGKGFGKYLMGKVEQYCRDVLNLKCMYLSTKGQERFYFNLGFVECEPISIYGSFKIESKFNGLNESSSCRSSNVVNNTNSPVPPPLPKTNCENTVSKTFMNKSII